MIERCLAGIMRVDSRMAVRSSCGDIAWLPLGVSVSFFRPSKRKSPETMLLTTMTNG